MAGMDAWDLALLALAGYLAVMSLVRLMMWRRNAILDELSEQVRQEQEQQRLQKKKERQKQLQEEVRQRFAELRDAA